MMKENKDLKELIKNLKTQLTEINLSHKSLNISLIPRINGKKVSHWIWR